jgi:hypothetical protein
VASAFGTEQLPTGPRVLIGQRTAQPTDSPSQNPTPPSATLIAAVGSCRQLMSHIYAALMTITPPVEDGPGV